MRYYDLDESGKVEGSYAVLQPDKELTLLEDAPNDESMWDGSQWVPDPDIVNARLATDALIAAKTEAIAEAKEKIASMSADVDKADSIDGLKLIIRDLIKQVKVLIT